jgi:hypothetical protein
VGIVIGVVTHSTHRVLFREAASTLGGVDLEWVSYDHEEEIRDRVAEFLRTTRLDGFLAGPVPYTASRELLPPGLPVGVIRSSALDLSGRPHANLKAPTSENNPATVPDAAITGA